MYMFMVTLFFNFRTESKVSLLPFSRNVRNASYLKTDKKEKKTIILETKQAV